MTDTTNTSSQASQPEFPPDNDGNRLWWLIGVIAVVLAVIVTIIVSDGIRNWLALHTGVLNGGPDPFYNFWSGIGSDIGEVTLISAVGIGVYTGVRKVNCHSKRCWRIGHHQLEGTPYILCRHHHPGVPNGGATHEHILNEHRKHMVAKAAEQAGRPSS